MSKILGTDGFRGEANEILTAEHAYKTGRFIGYRLKRVDGRAKVVIGKDTRRSSICLSAHALVAGLRFPVTPVFHVTTTPSVSYVVCENGGLRLQHQS